MLNIKNIILFLYITPLLATNIDDIKKSMILNYIEQTQNIKIIQKENEDIIRQNAIYYKSIVEASRKYYQNYIGKRWGDNNVKLSTKKTFTQYSDDMKSRESVDFKNGKVTMEVITNPNKNISPKVFEKKLQSIKNENIIQALQKDPVAKLSSKYLKRKGIVQKLQTKSQAYQFLKGLIVKSKIEVNELKEKIIKLKNGKKKKIISVTIKMIPKYLEKIAKRYKEDVLKEAKRFHVRVSHIFGTIQTESYFNPLARSPVPAYGLMQIVPATAGKDAYFALKGKKRLLPPYYLYNSKNNIELGTKYIQIIKYKYLKGIKNKKSLFYCSATAYNAGIGTLIKSFTGSYSKREEAIRKINSMTPDEVYHHLRTSKRLSREARDYVKKVKEYSQNYYKWDIKL